MHSLRQTASARSDVRSLRSDAFFPQAALARRCWNLCRLGPAVDRWARLDKSCASRCYPSSRATYPDLLVTQVQNQRLPTIGPGHNRLQTQTSGGRVMIIAKVVMATTSAALD